MYHTNHTRVLCVISYKTRGLWSHQKRAFLTPISCYDKRTSKTRVFGDSKARVKNARFIGNHTSRTRVLIHKTARFRRAFSIIPKRALRTRVFMAKRAFAVKSHAFDVSVCNQTPEQAFMTTLACHTCVRVCVCACVCVRVCVCVCVCVCACGLKKDMRTQFLT